MAAVNSIPCIVLAGGFGTRLKSVVNDVAKPMALMGHKPFLHVLLDYLHTQGIAEFVLSLGHKHETVIEYFDKLNLPYSLQYVIEQEPLGTGGAIRKALESIATTEAFVCNGDTFFALNLTQFLADKDLFLHERKSHKTDNLSCFMALKHAKGESRFGFVQIEKGSVVGFGEPSSGSGFQNAGFYWIDKLIYLSQTKEGQFSLEQDYFPRAIEQGSLAAQDYDAYFIDMGIPEDFARARQELSVFFIDRSWTLFLDRDGVINERVVGGYITKVEDFHFLPRVKKALSAFSHLFGRILVVTNQQGIGKGLMTKRNLEEVHRYMRLEIEESGGRLDQVYFAPHLAAEDSELRKPAPGMALLAKQDFPEIDFSKSVMIGDTDSDIAFGKALGMITVKVEGHEARLSNPDVLKKDLFACCSIFEKVPN